KNRDCSAYFPHISSSISWNFRPLPAGESGSDLVGLWYSEQADGSPLQPSELRAEDLRWSLAGVECVSLHVLVQVNDLPSRWTAAAPMLGIQCQGGMALGFFITLANKTL